MDIKQLSVEIEMTPEVLQQIKAMLESLERLWVRRNSAFRDGNFVEVIHRGPGPIPLPASASGETLSPDCTQMERPKRLVSKCCRAPMFLERGGSPNHICEKCRVGTKGIVIDE